ncbi:hypothetical protein V5O48_011701 [Marasmius crinis-equi]|uniref:Uncharacterized protein n=1 Tax=Marasmius crinis-equi TaxID=585013 RepID=A0ABR3F4V9_9AGAR
MRQFVDTTIPHPLSPPPPLLVKFQSRMLPAGALAAKMQASAQRPSPSPEPHGVSTAELETPEPEHPPIPAAANIDRLETQLSAVIHRVAMLEGVERGQEQAPPDYVSSQEHL